MHYLYAFLVGGAFCLIGQILIDKTNLTPAKILTGFVLTGVLLGGIGVYDYLVDFAGAGATVPLCGFGNLMANGVKDAIDKNGFLGIFTGGFSASAGGITASIVFSLFVSFFVNAKEK